MFCCTPSRKRNPEPVVTRSRTTMRVHTLEHFWTIENFSKCHQRDTNFIDSAPFYSDPSHKFFMRLYPMSDSEEKDDRKNISMYLNFRSGDKAIEAATVGCKFSIVNRYGLKSYTIDFKHKIANGSGWGWRKFLKRSAVVDCSCLTKNLLPGFLPSDKLTIHCEVTYVTNIETDPAPLAPLTPAKSKSVTAATKKVETLKKATEDNEEKKGELKKVASAESLDTLQSYGSSSNEEEAPEEEKKK